MGKRGKMLVVIVCVVAAGMVIHRFFRQSEPVYQGKSLSFWITQYHTNHWSAYRDAKLEAQAQAALQQMGTNAIAPLLKRLSTKDSVLFTNILRRVPANWLAKFHLPALDAYRLKADEYRGCAADGFDLMGMKATPAVPALIALTNEKDERVRYLAFYTLRSMGPAAKEALPLMLQHLNDPDWIVRTETISALGTIHEQPDKIVPILQGLVQSNHSDEVLCCEAIQALWSFREQSAPALPLLRSLLTDKDAQIRSAASNAIILIAPNDAKDK